MLDADFVLVKESRPEPPSCSGSAPSYDAVFRSQAAVIKADFQTLRSGREAWACMLLEHLVGLGQSLSVGMAIISRMLFLFSPMLFGGALVK